MFVYNNNSFSIICKLKFPKGNTIKNKEKYLQVRWCNICFYLIFKKLLFPFPNKSCNRAIPYKKESTFEAAVEGLHVPKGGLPAALLTSDFVAQHFQNQ